VADARGSAARPITKDGLAVNPPCGGRADPTFVQSVRPHRRALACIPPAGITLPARRNDNDMVEFRQDLAA
jgi:hypothetical protein